MSAILTLIAAPGKAELDAATVAATRAAMTAAGAACGEATVLAAGMALDIAFAGIDPAVAARVARRALAGRPIDAIAQPAQGRRKALLVADMDSTIIAGETIDALAERVGVADEVRAITAAAMGGELDFAASLRRRVALLAGADAGLLAAVCDQAMTLNPGARALVATMRAAGAHTVLVSGGFTAFTARAAALAGFDADQGNRLEIAGGRLTGRIVEPIINRDGKRRALAAIAAARGLTPGDALAVGDGANDLDMLGVAGLGIAYHARPAVAAAAAARIDHADLTALLYAQGYRADEILAGD